jgi:hypothetical protein
MHYKAYSALHVLYIHGGESTFFDQNTIEQKNVRKGQFVNVKDINNSYRTANMIYCEILRKIAPTLKTTKQRGNFFGGGGRPLEKKKKKKGGRKRKKKEERGGKRRKREYKQYN